MLAFSGADELAAVLAARPVAAAEVLRARPAEIRVRGYAVEESTAGRWCLAAPVLGRGRWGPAAGSVCAAGDAVPPGHADEVVRTVAEMTQRL